MQSAPNTHENPSLRSPFDQGVTFVYTKDLDAARAFYNTALQLPVALEQRDEHGELKAIIFAATSTCFFGCVLVDPQSLTGTAVVADGVTLTLAVPTKAAVDEWAEKLSTKGISLVKPPTLNSRYEIYHIFFRDPDGHLCEIQCFLSPHWPKPIQNLAKV
eukprot:gnl/TRDRNA2_/TRDRNA2_201196_c0_seq1.p1 gnl/TRDRNA2_/TRDRNA2_201196_c0~~gnl/TRDRNA2_/TRDRNA2_201196_c0_seq1.p1  ORF type:complete len:160 (-),score=28.10 gnl/TRDRNA2_/TRDRNA2_201196_c0_seq1:61-540(-)